MSKLLLLTLNEQEEKAIDKIIAAIADCISLEAVQTIPVPASFLSFDEGLGISQQIKILYVTSHKDREFFGIEYSIPMLAIPLFKIFYKISRKICHFLPPLRSK